MEKEAIKKSLLELRKKSTTATKKLIKLHSIDDAKELNYHKHIINEIALFYCENYKWDENISKISNNLIYYFNGIEHEYKLDKSIALTGNYGVGKTMLMNIFSHYLKMIMYPRHNPNGFIIYSLEDLLINLKDFNNISGISLMNSSGNESKPKPRHLLINEFGYDYTGKFYGTSFTELFEMFIMKRYDIYQDYGKLTHVTMNIDVEDMKKLFSTKLYDRFKEMFQIIHIPGNSKRK